MYFLFVKKYITSLGYVYEDQDITVIIFFVHA